MTLKMPKKALHCDTSTNFAHVASFLLLVLQSWHRLPTRNAYRQLLKKRTDGQTGYPRNGNVFCEKNSSVCAVPDSFRRSRGVGKCAAKGGRPKGLRNTAIHGAALGLLNRGIVHLALLLGERGLRQQRINCCCIHAVVFDCGSGFHLRTWP